MKKGGGNVIPPKQCEKLVASLKKEMESNHSRRRSENKT